MASEWSSSIRIVVVDDNAQMRYLVRKVLHQPPKFDLVGEAADGLAAVELVKQLQPDIVIMDVHMPRLDGIEATKRITSSVPHSIVIGFSTYADGPTRTAVHEAGSVAFVPKEDIYNLPHVIDQVLPSRAVEC